MGTEHPTEAIVVDRDHRLGVSNVETPDRLAPGEVRVLTGLVGVCATDREIVSTGAIFRIPEGEEVLVLGHEASGQVVELGPGVIGLQPGDWVVPVVTPGRNRGIDSHGYFREQFVESADWLVRVPAAISDIAVLVEPLTITHHALREAVVLLSERRGVDLRSDPSASPQQVLVIGAGPIGLLGAFLCRVWGYPTTVVDIVSHESARAKLAIAAGCDYIRAGQSGSMVVDDRAFDLVLHTAPSPGPVLTYLPALRRSGVLSLVGWQGRPHETRLDLAALVRDAVHEEWALIGTLGARPMDFLGAVKALTAMRERFPAAVNGIVTRTCPRDRFEDAFAHQPQDIAVAIDFRVRGEVA